ncbi:MAG TPA: hypothetical protein VK203_10345 [Nostocaceae cyanobacterium]|nr:hypothetical protein [Nostocaceae cyanobacterium]
MNTDDYLQKKPLSIDHSVFNSPNTPITNSNYDQVFETNEYNEEIQTMQAEPSHLINIINKLLKFSSDTLQKLEELEQSLPKIIRIHDNEHPQIQKINDQIQDFNSNFRNSTKLPELKNTLASIKKEFDQRQKELNIIKAPEQYPQNTSLLSTQQQPAQASSPSAYPITNSPELIPIIENLKSELEKQLIGKLTAYIDEKITQERKPLEQPSEIKPEPVVGKQNDGYISHFSPATIEQSVTNPPSTPEYNLHWIPAYNDNPNYLKDYAIEVSETEESINQRRLDGNQPAVIERVKKGNYWVISSEDRTEQYLVPKGDLKITEFNLQTIQSLFECRGDAQENPKFQLVKPAVVQLMNSVTWQVTELGILQF